MGRRIFNWPIIRRKAGIGVVLVATAFAVVACGGRVARPLEASSPLDAKLTCAHITAEYDVNLARANDIMQEQEAQHANNVGILLVAPLFVNLNDTEQSEVQALHARNEVLRSLMTEKDCQPS